MTLEPGMYYSIIWPWEEKAPQIDPLPIDEAVAIECPECSKENMRLYPNGDLWCQSCGTGLRPKPYLKGTK